MLSFHDLLKSAFPTIDVSSLENTTILGVREDSRLIRPGDLFVARAGTRVDGTNFANDAIARGAAAIITEKSLPGCTVPQAIVRDASAALSLLAQTLAGHPSHSLRVFGVTGTNGKTTVAYLMRHMLQHYQQRCGMIGTVELDDGQVRQPATMTTPGAVEVAEWMAAMRNKGCQACAMEVSSHSLHQNRVAGVQFAAAAFTNLTGDHLNYHRTMDNYASAKARLFEMLSETAVAAVNADDPWTSRMIRDCRGRIIRFGFNKTSDYYARDISVTAAGTRFILHTPDGNAEVSMPLVGRHNIENALAACALLGEVSGFSVHQLAAGLANAPGAPGRLQPIRCGQNFNVFVDYAHTDDALENVLTALRPLTRGRLRVLFGCGGDRDATKRPRMAKVAEKLADDVYVSSDNPRSESPHQIIEEVCAGFSPAARLAVHMDADRRTAIRQILADAGVGDVVLIAGKGHENYQEIAGVKHHFDDVEECTDVLRRRELAA